MWHDILVPQDIIDDIYVDLKRKVYPKDNYVLIGFMGSGKTTFGKALAKHCGMDFLDTDEYIEQQAGKSIAQIFEEDGEAAFRQIETETLVRLRDSLHNTVVATGGGMPLRKENARLLKEIGRVNYLTATSREIYDRVKGDTKTHRRRISASIEKARIGGPPDIPVGPSGMFFISGLIPDCLKSKKSVRLPISTITQVSQRIGWRNGSYTLRHKYYARTTNP